MNYLTSTKPHHLYVAMAITGACLIILSTVVPTRSQNFKTYEFALKGGSLDSAPRPIRVVHGDRIELNWRSDEKAEIHLHGYDKRLVVPAGGIATMTIDCTATGRFPITLHGKDTAGHGHKPLIYFEVHPK